MSYNSRLYNDAEHEKEMLRWRAENGEELRVSYPLTKDSVVFDVGGYTGNWGKRIYDKFKCNLYSFEPVKRFYEQYRNNVPNSKLFNYGLLDKDEIVQISVSNDSTSLYRNFAEKEQIRLRNISAVIKELNVTSIDLMQMNCEGGEYPLLQCLIDTGVIKIIKNIQIQFHKVADNSREVKRVITKQMENTHTLVWKYADWVWESWKIK